MHLGSAPRQNYEASRRAAFYITADGLDDRECRFDDIGTRKGTTKLIRHAQLMDGERFFQTLFQAASGTRIQMHQLVMQVLQRPLRIGVVDHGIGVLQFSSDTGFMLFGQVIYDVAFLVNLAALDEGRLTRVPTDRRVQCFAAIQNIQLNQGRLRFLLRFNPSGCRD